MSFKNVRGNNVVTATKDNCKFTKENIPTSFKSEKIDMTVEQIEETSKNAKVFPWNGCSLLGANIKKLILFCFFSKLKLRKNKP